MYRKGKIEKKRESEREKLALAFIMP